MLRWVEHEKSLWPICWHLHHKILKNKIHFLYFQLGHIYVEIMDQIANF